MNLPFAPGPTSKYAPVALVNGITNAGYTTDQVSQVVEHPGGYWLVFFKEDISRLVVTK